MRLARESGSCKFQSHRFLNERQILTSVIAWLAVDSRQPTGLYFASDSRRSFPTKEFRDDCTKLYIAEGSEDIFAFSGDVQFAQQCLTSICTAIESDQIPAGLKISPHGRAEWIEKFLCSRLDTAGFVPQYDTTILYGTRFLWGPQAIFYLTSYTLPVGSGQILLQEYSTDLQNSAVIELAGSGRPHIRRAVSETSDVAGEFSRAFFSGFYDSVSSGNDKSSGGAIQLVCLGCKSHARHIGVVLPEGPFYKGRVYEGSDTKMLWRNTKFERVSADGNLVNGAQRHGWRQRT